jgi:hypothetical protein
MMHIYMGMSQGNTPYSYLKQTKMSFFFFYKIGEQKGGIGPVRGVGTSGRENMWRRGIGR